MNIEEVLEALSDIETSPGSDYRSEDELDDRGRELSGIIFPGFCKGKGKGKLCRTAAKGKGKASKLITNGRQ